MPSQDFDLCPELNAHSGMPLTLAPLQKSLKLKSLEGSAESCQRLREMGFCESAEIVKIAGGNNCICLVCGVRVALNAKAAQQIYVEPAEPGIA